MDGMPPHPAVQPGCMDLVLRKRKGFVRLALEAGADLVPVLAFGGERRPGWLATCCRQVGALV